MTNLHLQISWLSWSGTEMRVAQTGEVRSRGQRVLLSTRRRVLKKTWKHLLRSNFPDGRPSRKTCWFTNLGSHRHSRKRGRGSKRKPYCCKGLIGDTRKRKLGVHQLACYVRHGKPPTSTPDVTASHLCHERTCCNPRHLTWESASVNLTRYTCLVYGNKFSECYDEKFCCPHKPTCFHCKPTGRRYRNRRRSNV